MHQDLHEIHSLIRLIVKHLGHQIFEFLAERRAVVLLMRPPEEVMLLQAEQVIVPVGHVRLPEGLHTGTHDEDYDSKGKCVRHGGLVAAFHHDFWCHVAFSADFFATLAKAAPLRAAQRAGEAEINELQVEVVVEDQVLQLEIPVAYSGLVHRADGLNQLLHVDLHDGPR